MRAIVGTLVCLSRRTVHSGHSAGRDRGAAADQRVREGQARGGPEVGQGTGCGTTFNAGPIHSGLDARQFYVVRATYTDNGAPGSVQLTGQTDLNVWPKRWQAEHFEQLSGPLIITASSAEGGKRLGDVQNGEWVRFHPVSLKGITGIQAAGVVGQGWQRAGRAVVKG